MVKNGVKNDTTGTINKTAIKNFAIYSRNKLIQDIKNKAALIGITESGIKEPLSSSTGNMQFFEIGTQEPYRIEGKAIEQRKALIQELESREKNSAYQIAYETLIEEVAYTWFNRIIAIRFMEVNNYMPDRIRVLSSGVKGINEPEFITHVLETSFDFIDEEKERIIDLKTDGSNIAMDELFQFLFIKQCNALNANLPELFEKTNDYTELLLTVSYNDVEGVIYKLVHEVPEEDFDVASENGHGQVEIIGWLYQYYNTEPKAVVDKAVKAKKKVDKFQLPAKTQLFTPDWIVKYMVENSLGRLWIEKLHVSGDKRSEEEIASQFGWQYYLPEADQVEDVQVYLGKIRKERSTVSVEDITFIDPAMGSFHIGIYAFEVFMQFYESEGYTIGEAAKLILEKNLHGLEIDKRATQLSYFACMMQARKYNRKILDGSLHPHVYEIIESNDINLTHLDYMGNNIINEEAWSWQKEQIISLVDTFHNAKEYGSLIEINSECDIQQLKDFVLSIKYDAQISLFNTLGLEETQKALINLIDVAWLLSNKYDVVVTNPPYMGSGAMNSNLVEFGKKNYSNSKSDLFAMFIECWNKRTKYNGCNAMITMQSWMFLSSYENMRSNILNKYTISHLMHMENMVLGIAFGTAATLFWNRENKGFAGTYNYVKYNSIKKNRPSNFPDKEYRFSQINQELFKKISGAPIAYWAKDGIIEAFMKGIPLGQLTVVRNGMKTGDNNRFLRYWWEIEDYKLNISAKSADEAINSMKKWFPYNKGGELRKWYGNNEFVVNWENGGEEVFNAAKKDGRNVQDYPMDMKFKPSVTWSLITSAKPTFRYKVSNLSDIAGMSMYKANERILYYLGFCNTSIALEMLEMLAPSVNSQAGDIARLPIITNDKYDLQINSLVEDNIDIAKANWNSFEVSWDFLRNPMIRDFSSIAEACKQWEKEDKLLFNQMKLNEEELNRIFIDIYNLDGVVNSEINDKDITFQRSNLEYNIKEYISYAIGCMLGRYSLDSEGLVYAGGDFDEARYSKFIPYRSNVIPITDQEYFSDDILNKFVEFVAVCFGESTLEKNLNFIAQVLDENSATSRETIRNYFVNDFFKEHCNRYSVKGSGKRPIYWLYDSGRQDGFKALVYMHRYTEDTTGKVRVDYLHKVQKIYEKMIYGLQENIANSKDAKEIAKLQKRIEKLTKQLKECKEYDERLGHMALERVPVDLDDGVKVNYLKVQTDSKGKFYQILAEI